MERKVMTQCLEVTEQDLREAVAAEVVADVDEWVAP